MKIEVLKSFEKDISKISDKKLAAKVLIVINNIETCKNISEIRHLKKLQHSGNYYRIQIGNHRLGFKVLGDTIMIMRFLDRKDIYKYFP